MDRCWKWYRLRCCNVEARAVVVVGGGDDAEGTACRMYIIVRTHGPHKHRATKDERVMLLLALLVIFPWSVS